jgi:multiple sugar transport system substrate-binding protein
MKKVKFTGMIALCAAVLLVLAACGDTSVPAANNQQDQQGSPAQQIPAVVPDVTEGEEVVIKYAMWGDDAEVAELKATIERFNREFPWITVEIVQIDRGEYETWMNTMAASGTLPDTAIMAEPMVIPWAQRGALLPIDVDAIVQAVGDTPLPHLSFQQDGKPLAYSVCNNIVSLFYNEDMFAAAGVDVPPKTWQTAWTWDEFIDVAKTLTLDSAGRNAHDAGFDRNNIAQYGFRHDNATWMLEAWAHANGASWFDGPSNVTIDSAASVEAIQMLADLHLVHGVSPQFGTNEGTIDAWLVQDTAMVVNGTWSFGVWLGGAREEHGLNFNVGVLPRMNGQGTVATAGVNVLMSDTRNPEAGSIWLAWYAQPENAWGLVESGIWMPIFSQWYSDESLMRRWADNDFPGRGSKNFPPFEDYRAAVIEASLSPVVHSAAWYTVGNMDVFLDVLGTVLAPVWDGSQTVQEAISGGMGALRSANAS